MKNLYFVILSAFFLVSVNSYAQWSQIYPGFGRAIALDNADNVYVTGRSYTNNLVAIKYNLMGVQQWIQTYSSPGRSIDGKAIAVDDSANIIVCGESMGEMGFPQNILTIKYNSLGVQKWVRTYHGPVDVEYVTSIAIDDLGNIYVAGSSTGFSNLDYLIIKYNLNGDLVWVQRYNGPIGNFDQLRSMSIDKAGNVIVTGVSVEAQSNVMATIKYDSSGNQQWIRKYANGIGESVAVNDSGEVFITGKADNKFAIIKYSPNGDSDWTQIQNLPGNTFGTSVKIDVSGNVYVLLNQNDIADIIKYNSQGEQLWVNQYQNRSVQLGFDSLENVYVLKWDDSYNPGIFHCKTIKYNSNGILQWVQVYEYNYYSDNEYPGDMKVDPSGNVYVTGTFCPNSSARNITTVKFTQQVPRFFHLTSLIEGFYNNVSNSMIADTVRVEIRNSTSPYSIMYSELSIPDSSGNGTFELPYVNNENSYYLVAKHRNSIETWSKLMSLNSYLLSYDFTSSANMAYGNNLVLKGSKYCIYSGDIDQDGVVDLTDLYRIYNAAITGVSGYVNTDLNGDNFTDLSDLTISFNNTKQFIMVVRP